MQTKELFCCQICRNAIDPLKERAVQIEDRENDTCIWYCERCRDKAAKLQKKELRKEKYSVTLRKFHNE